MKKMKVSIVAPAIAMFLMFFGMIGFAQANSGAMTKEKNVKITPDQAIKMLMEGNERFVNGKLTQRDWQAQVKATAGGQFPYAAVVSCLDSRIPTEVVFDQGIGDLFVGRVAGNFVNDDLLGSLEFAATGKSGDDWVGVKVIMVMGHTSCGAVKGAVAEAQLGLLTSALANINPAIKAAKDAGVSKDQGGKFVQAVSNHNVKLTMQKLRDRSLVLRGLIDDGKVKLVGAMYDLNTGKISLLD